ncbi:hypothetical protein Scep_010075 [Stephania cephalantha]|uniref:Phosphate transporter PHO1 n=2 Tax=Magnoliopsida TaxID=3398 RepID=A0AAP0PEW1_9MAGN
MVKFSKELEAQLIPEWKDAFVNYWHLKKIVKKIKLSQKTQQTQQDHSSHDFGLSVFDSVRYVLKKFTNRFSCSEHKNEIIQVRSKNEGEEDLNRNELVQLFSLDDQVKDFFEILDDELNKVNQFYKTKEDEFVERGEMLNKQLDILLDLKKVINSRRRKYNQSRKDATGFLPRSNSSPQATIYSESGSELEETSLSSTTGSPNSDIVSTMERNVVMNFIGSAARSPLKSSKTGNKPKMMGMRIDIPATTPTRTITALTSMLWEDLINNPKKEGPGEFIYRKKIQCAEKMIRGAFVELYRGLGLLKTYSSLNMVAFVKILKKFDKVSNQRSSENYMKVVKRSHFISSDKVSNTFATSCSTQRMGYCSYRDPSIVKLMYLESKLGDEVESIFTKQFTNNDRKKAMKYLRPQQNKDTHMLTFLVGTVSVRNSHNATRGEGFGSLNRVRFGPVQGNHPLPHHERTNRASSVRLFTGCFVTLFIVYAMLAHFSGMFTSQAGYMETVHPIFSIFALLSLHLFLYGCNLYMWKSTRINYNFIFELSPSTELKYRDVFLICTSLMTAVVGAMVVHLLVGSIVIAPHGLDAIPAFLLILSIGFLICPFNIFYRPSRYYFLRVMRHIICSPFYKVVMVDFFMADQLTSQIPLLRHMESTACYIFAECFKTHSYATCRSSKLYKELAKPLETQIREDDQNHLSLRWFDEGETSHLANLGKYVSAMVAAGARLTFAMQPTRFWWIVVVITTSVATIYQLYWDFVKDWGLLNRNCKHPWLREELILKNKSVYFGSIALNLVLRLAWIESILHLKMGAIEYRLVDFLLASLEIFRRGHWNFYRLENEHLTNVGKYRAVNMVPLPFRDVEFDA